MRFLFDFYELSTGKGKSIGIASYAYNLLACIVGSLVKDDFLYIVCNSSFSSDFKKNHTSNNVMFIDVKGGESKLSKVKWTLFNCAHVCFENKIDVYLNPKGMLPFFYGLNSIRTVSIVHDLIPFWYKKNFPGYFGFIEELYITKQMSRTINKSTAVISISESTADDIKRIFKRDCGVFVVYNGIPLCSPSEHVETEPYIFAVASGMPHKNANYLFEAYKKYRRSAINPLRLIVCGVDAPKVDGVITVKGISSEKLHAYYKGADMFIFASLIEGFGFPPIEAMSYGTFTLCSDISSLREVTKNACIYFDPFESFSLAAAIKQVQDFPEEYPSNPSALIEVSKQYNWDSCASGVLNVVKNLSN
jgi:glycosyltransferase involved in cell wall biosynthesis